ncbi:MAG: hypothetical protein CML16_08100 [Pusillimonas sp.]|nr:hypothetical protein [Pusillimonas sp.]MBC42977.1 hypothetical protein [Pusillimonas sp.]HCP78121.1 hypothetical protein [Pusillimonas sp.]|tara:strand:+ start:394 stop:732 length:339 start_codon:yes stop_codon:yes gene_type:complete
MQPQNVRHKRPRTLFCELSETGSLVSIDAVEFCQTFKVYAVTPQPQQIPEGYKLVPIESTEEIIVEGFESAPDEHFTPKDEWERFQAMSGCQQAAHKARLCWEAMLKAAPKP